MLSILSSVLTTYKADTSDQKAKIKELEGAEKELAETRLAAAEAHNKSVDGILSKLATLGVAIGVAKAAWDGYKLGVEEARLSNAAAGVDLDRLSDAAGGLKTNLELLTFAAKAHKSAWANTQGDLEIAEKAMRALEQRGVSTEDATNAVTNAVVSLRTKGLKAFGTDIDDSKVKFDEFGHVLGTNAEKLEQHTKIMEALRKVAGEVADGQDAVGDSMTRTQVKLENSWADLKKGLGQLVLAMQPLLEALAAAVGLVAYLANASGMSDVMKYAKQQDLLAHSGTDVVGGLNFASLSKGAAAQQTKNAALVEAMLNTIKRTSNALATPTDVNEGLDFGKLDEERHKAAEEAAKKAAHEAAEYASKVAKETTDLFVKQLEEEMANPNLTGQQQDIAADARRQMLGMTPLNPDNAGLTGGGWTTDAEGNRVFLGSAPLQAANNNQLGFSKGETDSIGAGLKNFYAPGGANDNLKAKSILDSTFGSTAQINGYKDAWSGLSDAVVAGYKAMVEGSMSFGAAFEKTIASALEQEGSKMQVLAIENTAYGLAALALGPIGGTSAASYFAAAGMFEAGALAAGVAAHYLGAGSSSSAAAGSSAGGAAAGTSGSLGSTPSQIGPAHAGHGTQQVVIVIGDQWTDQTERMKQIAIQQTVNKAFGNLGYGVTVAA